MSDDGLVSSLRGAVVGALVLASVGCASPFPSYAGQSSPTSDPRPPQRAFEATVSRVVDGDTFIARRADRELRVRLIGIDAPESVTPGLPVECYGAEAGRQLKRMLTPGTSVRAAYEDGGRRDRFGRELWDVWLPKGSFVQARLVRRGAAEARAYPPHTEYADRLDRVERRARAVGAGLWGAC